MSRPRVVVDSSVVINFLTGGAQNDKAEWFDHSKWVFEAHERAAHEIINPTIVIAEVAGCGEVRGSHLSKNDRYKRVKRVREWINSGNFLSVEISLGLAEEAAEIAIKYQLTGADACILASAIMYGSPIRSTLGIVDY